MAAHTYACCPRGSLSIPVPAPPACSSRTMAGRVRQVRQRVLRWSGALAAAQWPVHNLVLTTAREASGVSRPVTSYLAESSWVLQSDLGSVAWQVNSLRPSPSLVGAL